MCVSFYVISTLSPGTLIKKTPRILPPLRWIESAPVYFFKKNSPCRDDGSEKCLPCRPPLLKNSGKSLQIAIVSVPRAPARLHQLRQGMQAGNGSVRGSRHLGLPVTPVRRHRGVHIPSTRHTPPLSPPLGARCSTQQFMNLAWMDQEHFIWKKKYKFINWCLNILFFLK
jgi:hypothetical protein